MADPTLQTFCCIQSNETHLGAATILKFRSGPYNIVCIVSSLLGILGAIYQILPRNEKNRRISNSYLRGRYIIVWLATADLLASLAVLIRSISWLVGKLLLPPATTSANMSLSLDTLFCAITSGWIQYFYTATCLWTLCYAVDVLKVVNGQEGQPKLYHLLSWGLPALLSILGLSILYLPNINCHDMGTNAFMRILPNYIFTYLPIAVVMIVNPIIYAKAAQKAEKVVVSAAGRFTQNERTHLRTLRIKFLSINLVFYFCWLPNLINAFLLWTLWSDLPRNFVLFDWYLMAVVNPLQALLNAFVYRTWGPNQPSINFPWTKKTAQDFMESSLLIEKSSSNSPNSSLDNSKLLAINDYGSL